MATIEVHSPRPRRNGVSVLRALLLAVAAIWLTAAAAGGALAGPDRRAAPAAVELQQTLGKGDRLTLVLSDTGASATETRNKGRVGVIVRYEDATVLPLDYAKRTYFVQTIDESVAALKGERKLIDKVQIEVPTRSGSHNPDLNFPTLTPLDLQDEIAGQPAHAFAFRQEGVKTPVRVWLADDLPAPPDAIQNQVVGAIPLPLTSGRVLLRSEIQQKGGWVTGLDTISVREIEVTEETICATQGLAPDKAAESPSQSSVPARPLRWASRSARPLTCSGAVLERPSLRRRPRQPTPCRRA